jgi:hypothetical protein
MDEYGWGNTRLVIGEGKDKNDDEKFNDFMVLLKNFSSAPKISISIYFIHLTFARLGQLARRLWLDSQRWILFHAKTF